MAKPKVSKAITDPRAHALTCLHNAIRELASAQVAFRRAGGCSWIEDSMEKTNRSLCAISMAAEEVLK